MNHLLDDPRFVDNNARAAHQAELAELLQTVLKTDSCHVWIAKLSARGVPCGPIASVDQVLQDPQVLHRRMVVEMRDATGQPVKMIGSPIKMSATPTVLRRFPPALGQHTDEVAAEYGLAALLSGAKRSRAA